MRKKMQLKKKGENNGLEPLAQATLPEEENIDVTEQDIDKISSRQKKKGKANKITD